MRTKIVLSVALLLPYIGYAQEVDLLHMLNSTISYHPSMKSYQYKTMSKEQEFKAQQGAYFPTIDVGANYQYNDPTNIATPKEAKSAYVSAGWDIFDGGKRGALIDAKRWDYKAAIFEQEAFSKSVVLDVIQRYFAIQKLQANILVLEMKSNDLKYQIDRAKSFVKAGLATSDDVDKLQAVSDENSYTLDSMNFALNEQKENLKLNSGLDFDTLAKSSLQEPENISLELLDKAKILEAKANAVQESAKAVLSAHIPQIRIQNTYTVFDYNDLDSSSPSGVNFLMDKKNTLTVSANWRLFDGGQIIRQKEALKLQGMALKEEQIGAMRDQESSFRLAQKRLDTARSQIKSTQSALKAAQNTYEIVTQKFEAGLVDNVAYLDALNMHSATLSRYKAALYDYEVAKSLYYYFAGKNPKEYVR